MEKFELYKKTEVSSLKEILPIEESRNTIIKRKEELKNLVEFPLLKSCQELYDKNIKTLSSSANRKDLESGEIYIIIDFDNLSLENQEIIKQYGNVIDYDNIKAVKIVIPVDKTLSLSEIEQKAKRITDSFEKQPMTWAPKYSLEELKRDYGIDSEDKTFNNPEAWKDYYYDAKNKLFYLSEEHYQKANEEIINKNYD